MAIMAAYQIEEDMAGFLATYYGRSEELTSEAFMLKLEELSEKKNGNLVRTGKYYHHPEHYVKTSKVDE